MPLLCALVASMQAWPDYNWTYGGGEQEMNWATKICQRRSRLWLLFRDVSGELPPRFPSALSAPLLFFVSTLPFKNHACHVCMPSSKASCSFLINRACHERMSSSCMTPTSTSTAPCTMSVGFLSISPKREKDHQLPKPELLSCES